MTQYDPNTDPARPRAGEPGYVETTETVVVRGSNAGWWIAGVLGGLLLLGVLWLLFAHGEPRTDEALLEAQLDAAEAQAAADAALVQGQVAGAQASVEIAQADAARAAAEARAAEARATAPVIVEREVPVPVPVPAPAPAPDTPVQSPPVPQN